MQKGKVVEVKGKRAIVKIGKIRKQVKTKQKLKKGEIVNVFQGLAFK
jgi:hydrogenase maturation factor